LVSRQGLESSAIALPISDGSDRRVLMADMEQPSHSTDVARAVENQRPGFS
jgi:hypothetical protein